MNRPFYATPSSSTNHHHPHNHRQPPLGQAPASAPLPLPPSLPLSSSSTSTHHQHPHLPPLPPSSPASHKSASATFQRHNDHHHHRFHSRNSSDPQEYRQRPPPPLPQPVSRFESNLSNHDDTEEADEDEDDPEMTAYHSRSAGASNGSNSRPGSSSNKDSSGGNLKKPKTKSNKVFVCTGYGECTMQFTRSEHLARHIRKHTGERPFHCDCGRNFSRLDNLRQHMTTVHAQQYPPPSSNAPPARQPPQTKPPNMQLNTAPHRPSFKGKHRPGPLTLPAQGYNDRSPPGSPRFKAYSATAAQFPVTYNDPPPSPLATASGNFSGTNPTWHRPPHSTLPTIGPPSASSSSSTAGSTSSYLGHLSPPATSTFPPSPNTAYFGRPSSATYLGHNHYPPSAPPHHAAFDEKASRRQSWHEGGKQLPSIRTIWTQEDGGPSDPHHGQPYSPNNFNTSYLRSPVSSTKEDHPEDRRVRQPFSPVSSSRRSSLPSQSQPPFELRKTFERTPEEDEDYPMTNGIGRNGDPNTPSSSDENEAMDIDSKKITSIADLCHPERGRDERNGANAGGGNLGMDLLSQAAAAMIDHEDLKQRK